jgi:hypothetical protein
MSKLINKALATLPEFNYGKVDDALTFGIAYIEFQESLTFLSDTIRSMVSGDLEFVGLAPTQPWKVHQRAVFTSSGSKKKPKESITETNTFCIDITFNWFDKPHVITMHMPDIKQFNVYKIHDVNYMVKSVLTDPIFTIDGSGILTKTLMNKIMLTPYPFTITKTTTDDIITIESAIINGRYIDSKAIPLPVGLYILARSDWSSRGIRVVMEENYDASMGTGYKNPNTHMDLDPIVVICEDTNQLPYITILLSLYERFSSDILDMTNLDDEEISSMFTTIIGILTYATHSAGKTYYDTTKSLLEIKLTSQQLVNSVANLLDINTKARLAVDGIHVDDYIEMLEWLLHNYKTLYLNDGNGEPYLTSIYYILFNAFSSMNRELMKIRDRPSPIITRRLNNIPKFATTAITSGANRNIAIETITSPNDNAYLGITSSNQLQNNGDGVRASSSSKKGKLDNKEQRAWDLPYGSIQWATNSFTNPLGRLNFFIRLDENNRCILTKEERWSLGLCQSLLEVK